MHFLFSKYFFHLRQHSEDDDSAQLRCRSQKIFDGFELKFSRVLMRSRSGHGRNEEPMAHGTLQTRESRLNEESRGTHTTYLIQNHVTFLKKVGFGISAGVKTRFRRRIPVTEHVVGKEKNALII